jgi:small nuclear ribonucleoprotein (snRNP)-like protein
MNSYETPLAFMQKNLGDKVSVKLRNKVLVQGKLVAFDEHLNLMMEDATLKKEDKSHFKNLVYLRGDMITLAGKE